MNSGKGFLALNIIHKAMLMGQVLCAGVCFYLLYSSTEAPSMADNNRILQVISIVLSAAGFFGGASLFKKKLQEISIMDSAKEKFAAYRSACITQWALLEAPSIFCSVSYFLTGNYAFLALAAALILIFAITGPSKPKMAMQLGLSEQEIDEL